jgi:hypothetical protein
MLRRPTHGGVVNKAQAARGGVPSWKRPSQYDDPSVRPSTRSGGPVVLRPLDAVARRVVRSPCGGGHLAATPSLRRRASGSSRLAAAVPSWERPPRCNGPLVATAPSVRRPCDVRNSDRIRPTTRMRCSNRNQGSHRVRNRNQGRRANRMGEATGFVPAPVFAPSLPHPYQPSPAPVFASTLQPPIR